MEYSGRYSSLLAFLAILLTSWPLPSCQDDLNLNELPFRCDSSNPCGEGWLCGQGVCAPEVEIAVVIQGVSPAEYPELFTLEVCSALTVCYLDADDWEVVECRELPWPLAQNRTEVSYTVPAGRTVRLEARCDHGQTPVAVARSCPVEVVAGATVLLTLLPPRSMGPTINADGLATGLSLPRVGSAVAELGDGRILVAGGLDGPGGAVLDTAELFDPRTGDWTTIAGTLVGARTDAKAVLLASGGVAVVGGRGADGESLSSVEILDSGASEFILAPPLSIPRVSHTVNAVPQADSILIVGGEGDASLTYEWWHPSHGTVSEGALNEARWAHSATLVESRTGDTDESLVLVIGGASGAEFAEPFRTSVEIFPGVPPFDPPELDWFFGSMADQVAPPVGIAGHLAAFAPPSGRLFVTSGLVGDETPLPGTAVYWWDVDQRKWNSLGADFGLTRGHWRGATAVSEHNGTWAMPVIGGLESFPTGQPVNKVDLLRGILSSDGTVSMAAEVLAYPMLVPRWDQESIPLCDGRVLVVGGLTVTDAGQASATDITEVFSP